MPPNETSVWNNDNVYKYKANAYCDLFSEPWDTWCANYTNVKLNCIVYYCRFYVIQYHQAVTDPAAHYPTSSYVNLPGCVYFRLGWNCDRVMDDSLTREKLLDDRVSFKNLYVNKRKYKKFKFSFPQPRYISCQSAKDLTDSKTIKQIVEFTGMSNPRGPDKWYGCLSKVVNDSYLPGLIYWHKKTATSDNKDTPPLTFMLEKVCYLNATFRGSNMY